MTVGSIIPHKNSTQTILCAILSFELLTCHDAGSVFAVNGYAVSPYVNPASVRHMAVSDSLANSVFPVALALLVFHPSSISSFAVSHIAFNEETESMQLSGANPYTASGNYMLTMFSPFAFEHSDIR